MAENEHQLAQQEDGAQHKIFVLGDSRTGTTSLHKFFLDCGFKSIHYYVDEVTEIARKNGCDAHTYSHFKEFIDHSGFCAFSDYPTRIYFRELLKNYPSAYYILSTRRNVDSWSRSMQRFFSARTDVVSNMKHLCHTHIRINNLIRRSYAKANNFMEISIDDESKQNTENLLKFLNVKKNASLQKLNATS